MQLFPVLVLTFWRLFSFPSVRGGTLLLWKVFQLNVIPAIVSLWGKEPGAKVHRLSSLQGPDSSQAGTCPCMTHSTLESTGKPGRQHLCLSLVPFLVLGPTTENGDIHILKMRSEKQTNKAYVNGGKKAKHLSGTVHWIWDFTYVVSLNPHYKLLRCILFLLQKC